MLKGGKGKHILEGVNTPVLMFPSCFMRTNRNHDAQPAFMQGAWSSLQTLTHEFYGLWVRSVIAPF